MAPGRCLLLIERAIGNELKKQERVRGATLAQVDFDRIGLPAAGVILRNDEIDREAAENAEFGQLLPYLAGLRP